MGLLGVQMCYFCISNKVEIAKVRISKQSTKRKLVFVAKSDKKFNILIMKRADLILFNEDLMRKMRKAGIRPDDYKYADLYRDYRRLMETDSSRKVIILSLAQRYGYTDRQVYNIIKHLEKKID